MAQNKLQDLLNEIYDFVNNCRTSKMNGLLQVPKDELIMRLDFLYEAIPAEFERYQKVYSQKSAILDDTKKKADKLIEQAKQQAGRMVDDSLIVKEAYEKANKIVGDASFTAQTQVQKAYDFYDEICAGAYDYTDERLTDIEAILVKSLNEAIDQYKTLISGLQENLQIVQQNRSQLPNYDLEAEITRASQFVERKNMMEQEPQEPELEEDFEGEEEL